MIDLNGLAERSVALRKKKKLPTGKYEYMFLRSICEIAEAFNDHMHGRKKIGEELADAILLLLDISSHKKVDIEKCLTAKLRKLERRKYGRKNGYVVKK